MHVVNRYSEWMPIVPASIATAAQRELINLIKKDQEENLMNENKRKKIEAKLFQLFMQTDRNQNADSHSKSTPTVVKVIRRRKGKPDLQVA